MHTLDFDEKCFCLRKKFLFSSYLEKNYVTKKIIVNRKKVHKCVKFIFKEDLESVDGRVTTINIGWMY